MDAKSELGVIAQGKTLAERKKTATRVASMLEVVNPDALVASGVIKQGRHGHFDFHHRTMAGLVVRDSLMRQITGEPLASWALACFDSERRPLADAALAAVSMEGLVDAAERLAQEEPDSAVGLLGKAAHGAWAADPAWWQELIDSDDREWAQEALLKRFKSGGTGAAARLWPSYLMFERGHPAGETYIVRLSRVRRWLLEQLTSAEALDSLDESGRLYLARVPESLPPAFRAPLLQSLVKHSPGRRYSDALPFFSRFGSSAAPALDGYLDDDMLGHAAATCMWDWAPEKAGRLLGPKSKLSTEARGQLLWACPANHVAAAAEVLLAEPTLLDPSVRMSWAQKHLNKACSQAEILISIINTARALG